MRVVIAEDNALLREGLVLLLTSAGHEVVAVAGTGPEVLPALLEHRPDRGRSRCADAARVP